MKLNIKANELKNKLFALINEFKDLSLAILADKSNNDLLLEAHGQADQIACDLAAIYERTNSEFDLFTDALRDNKDQSFSVEI